MLGLLRTRTGSSARIAAATSGQDADTTLTTDQGEGSSRNRAPAHERKWRCTTNDLLCSRRTAQTSRPFERVHPVTRGASQGLHTPLAKPSAALSGLDAPDLSLSVFEPPSHTPCSTSIIDLTVDPPPPPTPVPSRPQPLAKYNYSTCFCPPMRARLMLRGHVCCGECLFTAIKMKQRRHTHTLDPRTNTAK
jgi:hypothetical protein